MVLVATQVKRRRGTGAENDAFTGAEGEITVDLTNKELRVHTGDNKAGGYGLARKDFKNITDETKNISNWSSNVSNCITNIPQDIKLELSSGTLTLKAGSKCYLKTDTTTPSITVVSDLTTTQTTNGTYFAIYNGSALTTVLTTTYDYSSLPNTYSLPLAVITVSGGTISSIDQVFNGFGYIGTAWFMLPGVKALVPNGLNADGTYKNIEFTNPSVYVYTPAASAKRTVGVELDTSGNITSVLNARYQNMDSGTTLPKTVSDTAAHCYYKIDENQWYITSGSTTANWTKFYPFYAGTRTDNGTTTSEFTTRTAFHTLDYSDREYIAHCAAPSNKYIDLTLPASGGIISAPADGYVVLNKTPGAANLYIQLANNSNGISITATSYNATLWTRIFIPVSKGDSVVVTYSFTGSTNVFRFVYANGAK